MLSTLFFSASDCTPKNQIVLIGEAHIVRQLENGNFEVTPAVIAEIAKLQNQVTMQRLEIEKLREIIESLRNED